MIAIFQWNVSPWQRVHLFLQLFLDFFSSDNQHIRRNTSKKVKKIHSPCNVLAPFCIYSIRGSPFSPFGTFYPNFYNDVPSVW